MTPKIDADFEVLPSDAWLNLTLVTGPIIGAVPLTIETVLAVFDPNLKRQMELEYSVNFKLGKE